MLSVAEISYYQKLLTMYRALLAKYLWEQQQWERTDVPKSLRTEIEMLRSHIMEVKGTLRGWNVDINNHPDDLDPNSDIAGEVRHQRELLKIHRNNLAILLRQQEQFAAGQAPPMLVNSLEHARNELRRIKGILRSFGVTPEDLPEEDGD